MSCPHCQPERCGLCLGPVPAAEAPRRACYGCGYYICRDCDTNLDLPFGGHRAEEHRAPVGEKTGVGA